MYRTTLSRLKTREVILIIILIFMLFYSFPLIKTKFNRFVTLSTLKAIGKSGVYTMKYQLDYKLDRYLKIGSRNLKQLYNFIDRFTSVPFTANDSSSVFKEDIYDVSSYIEYEECSAFSAFDEKGNAIFGRNLDIKGQHPILVLHTAPPNDYASISIVEIPLLGCTYDNSELLELFNHYSNRTPLLRAPYMPRDGMNEKGLTVATLNVPEEEIKYDSSKPILGRWQVLRLLLDKAATVQESVELMENYNCFDGSVHYFISDAQGNSAVVEYTNGRMVVIPSEENYQVVTNFYFSKEGNPGKGHTRYETSLAALKEKSGFINEGLALNILSDVKESSTVYSVVYNKGTGEVYIAYNKNYKSIYNFSLKIT